MKKPDSLLVSAARKYIGVPFLHQGRNKHGLDCAGLAWISFRDAGFAATDYRAYGRTPHDGELEKAMEVALGAPVKVGNVSEADLQAGDVVLMRFTIEPHHVGIIGDYPYGGFSLIHTSGHSRKVIEHRLAADHVKRITHIFRKPL